MIGKRIWPARLRCAHRRDPVAGMAMAAITCSHLGPAPKPHTLGDGVFLVELTLRQAPTTRRGQNPPYFGVRQGVRSLNLLMVDTQRT